MSALTDSYFGGVVPALACHTRENNPESEAHLTANRARFNAKCGELYRRLMSGERLTVLFAANSGISSLPRRVKDLREAGVAISDKWNGPVKLWFCSDADRTANALRFGP